MQRRVREGDGHVLREARPHLVGQAGSGVLLVHDDGYAASPGCEVGGRGDVAAEAHDDTGVGGGHGVVRCLDGATQ